MKKIKISEFANFVLLTVLAAVIWVMLTFVSFYIYFFSYAFLDAHSQIYFGGAQFGRIILVLQILVFAFLMLLIAKGLRIKQEKLVFWLGIGIPTILELITGLQNGFEYFQISLF